MKTKKINLFIILFTFIINFPIFDSKDDYYKNKHRYLWEEDMKYGDYYPEEKNSLEHCAKSNYKYFSYILTGAPVTFDHFVSKDNAVSKINRYK